MQTGSSQYRWWGGSDFPPCHRRPWSVSRPCAEACCCGCCSCTCQSGSSEEDPSPPSERRSLYSDSWLWWRSARDTKEGGGREVYILRFKLWWIWYPLLSLEECFHSFVHNLTHQGIHNNSTFWQVQMEFLVLEHKMKNLPLFGYFSIYGWRTTFTLKTWVGTPAQTFVPTQRHMLHPNSELHPLKSVFQMLNEYFWA